MAIQINGTSGISGVDGSAATPALQGSDSNTGISFGTDTVSINTGGTARATVDSSGNLGIGTTSPAKALHVSTGSNADLGNISIALGGTFSGLRDATITKNTSSPYGLTITSSNSGATHAPLIFETLAGAEKARIDTSGRLLVGTSTAPSAGNAQYSKLVVQGNTYAATDYGILNLQRGLPASGGITGTVGGIHFSDNTGNEFGLIQCAADGTTSAGDYPGRLVFSTTANGASSPTERVRITEDGTIFTRAATTGCQVVTNASASTSTILCQMGHSSTGIFNGTISFKITSNGDVTNANNSYGSLSDIKLKENIVDANSQWDDLKALQVRNYNFKEGQTHTQIGLIAQEVELVSPGLVNESPDRDSEGNDLGTVTKSVNYSVLYMKAVKALQEAMERIETLEARLTTLEGGTN